MQHTALRNNAQFNGAWTDLYQIGAKRVRAQAAPFAITSDLTAAATTQTYILHTFAVGDCIVYPLAQAWIKQKFTDHATEDTAATTLANLKVDVGITGATTQFIAGTNADLQQAINSPITGPVAAGLPYAHKTGTVNLLATLTSTAGNMSTATFGDLWIYVAMSRVGDHVRDLSA